MTPPVALTIAGSDSGGGAGIQADLRTFAALGVHGTAAVCALTAQNTRGVQGVAVTDPEFVDAQIASVVADFRLSAVKTGMLATAAIIEVVADRARQGHLPALVVDPVMVASSGDRLLDEGAHHAYLHRLIPLALVLTPNLAEVEVLTGTRPHDRATMADAARRLQDLGAANVVVKGGHLPGNEALDVLVTAAGDVISFSDAHVDTPNVHGTGCTLASAIAAHLAHGRDVTEAVDRAKRYLTGALRSGARWTLGSGHGPVDHMWQMDRVWEHGPR